VCNDRRRRLIDRRCCRLRVCHWNENDAQRQRQISLTGCVPTASVALLLLLLKLLCHPSDAAACELRTVITYTKVQHHWHDLTRDDVGLCAAGASSRTSPSSTCAMAAVAIVSMHTHTHLVIIIIIIIIINSCSWYQWLLLAVDIMVRSQMYSNPTTLSDMRGILIVLNATSSSLGTTVSELRTTSPCH
jgi:hypothetical protein